MTRHIAEQLSAYCDGELAEAERRFVEAHLRECSECSRSYEEVRLGARLASQLSLSQAPDSLWNDLHKPAAVRPSRRWIFVAAAASAAVLASVLLIFVRRPSGPSWEVTGLPGMARLRAGEVLQTDSVSKAEVKIANIGQITVDPNTRIRLLVTRSDQHRIALDRGTVEAMTWAPPRLFIVDTPSATAVDLGCRYTLGVEDDGSSLLHVTLGLVALDEGAGETIVPAGAFCRTRRGAGPGTPYFEDSSPPFQAALRALDSGIHGPAAAQQLQILLHESRVRDALSLWHLIPRVDPEARGLVYDRLAQLLPPPSGVTREGIDALDPKMMDAWKKVVSQLWQ
jgi:ferric-dicitrate binding protein FerR (iron transport regulator)